MNKQKLAAAFNEWMRRYIEHPEQFLREFQTVKEFLKEQKDGSVLSYGDECAEYLLKIMEEL
jgi:GrpB-like predicted nucleotidyltransferase (UPF0157 family)